jgi:hypothetical protein
MSCKVGSLVLGDDQGMNEVGLETILESKVDNSSVSKRYGRLGAVSGQWGQSFAAAAR